MMSSKHQLLSLCITFLLLFASILSEEPEASLKYLAGVATIIMAPGIVVLLGINYLYKKRGSVAAHDTVNWYVAIILLIAVLIIIMDNVIRAFG